MTIRTIRPAALQELCKSGQCVELIDVRTPAEFQSLHAFLGCGLVFAGVTNICPMMSILARMP